MVTAEIKSKNTFITTAPDTGANANYPICVKKRSGNNSVKFCGISKFRIMVLARLQYALRKEQDTYAESEAARTRSYGSSA